MMVTRPIAAPALAATVGLMIAAGGTAAAAEGRLASLRAEPAVLSADLVFNGGKIDVLGTVLPGYQVAVLCRGKDDHLALKQKGKRWGVLWMSVGEVRFEHIPSLYLLSTSAKLSSLAGEPELRRLGLGYQALEQRSGDGSRVAMFDELVRLRGSEGLFAMREGAARMVPGAGGISQVLAQCWLPAKVPMSDYEVQLFGFRNGQGKLLATQHISVEQAGLARLISGMAERHPLGHGLFAVVMAIVAGFLTGLVFRGSARKPH